MPDVAHAPAPSRRTLKGWIAAGLTAVLALAGVVAITVPAVATPGFTGEISGTVVLPGGGGADGATVTAHQYEPTTEEFSLIVQGSTTAGADGSWSFPELPVGAYAFSFSPPDTSPLLVTQFDSGDVTDGEVISNGSYVSIVQDEIVAAGTFAFQVGGTVTASVTTTALEPILGATVNLYRWSVDHEGTDILGLFDSAATDAGGASTFTGLPDGVYTADFAADGFATQLYGGVYGPDASYGDTFVVSGGDTTPISAELSLGGHITGVIKSAANGAGLAGIQVSANTYDGVSWFNSISVAETAANGAYDIEGLPPGDYRIIADPQFGPLAGQYVSRVFPAAVDLEHGTTVHVGDGATVTGKNISLLKPSAITGRITLAPASPVTIPGADDVSIIACDADSPCSPDFGGYEGVLDPATGNYRISGLAAGTYIVYVQYTGAGNYRDEYYNNVRDQHLATHIVVGSQVTVAGKNILLDLGSTISGTLTDRSGDPVPNYPVGAYAYTAGLVSEFRPDRWATTDVDGHYTIGGLPVGTYIVKSSPEVVGSLPVEYVGPWHGDTYNPQKATKIKLTVPNGATGIDLKVDVPASIEGVLTATGTGLPIADASIDVSRFDTPGGTHAQSVPNVFGYTGPDGSYELQVPPGEYLVSTTGTGEYRGRTFDAPTDADAPPAGTRISLNAGDAYTASWSLDLGGSYTGRIVDEGGSPLGDVVVDLREPIEGDMTGSNGRFDIDGLAAGPHRLHIQGDGLSYVSSLVYDAPATGYNAPPMELGDITLQQASAITGIVRSTSGAALPNVDIDAVIVLPGGQLEPVGYATSGPKGEFTVTGLPTGDIYLGFDAPGATYQYQYLGGSDIWALSDSVQIAAPGATEQVEARLVTGGAISGVLKNKVTGRVIPGAVVTLAKPDTLGFAEFADATETNSKGAYTFPGLEAGSYQLTFNAPGYETGEPLPYTVSELDVIVADRTTTTVNRSLIPRSKVSGVVKIGTLGAEGIEVTATDVNGFTATATTTSTGAYVLPLDAEVWTLFFSDPEGRVQSAYWKSTVPTGTADRSDATPVKVTGNGAALAARNITLTAGGGSIQTTVSGTDETDPAGTFTLMRIAPGSPFCTDAISTQTFVPPSGLQPLNDLLPLRNVRPGTYCLVVFGESALSDGGGPYSPTAAGPFEVTDGATTTLPPIDLGAPILLRHYQTPTVVPGSEPQIQSDGTPQVGEAIWVTPGTFTRDDAQRIVRWTRNGKPIAGAQELTYQLQPGDVGETIGVNIGATDFPEIGPESLSYSTTLGLPVVVADSPVAYDLPRILGKPNVGQVLTADPGFWSLAGLSFTYQWFRDASPIAGATAKTYKAVAADLGTNLVVEVTTHRPGYGDGLSAADQTVILPALALKATKAPTGKVVGADFVATPGTWSPAGATFAYSWREYDAGTGASAEFATTATTPVSGAVSATSRVTVIVTASKPGYSSTSVELQVRTGAAPAFTLDQPGLTTQSPALGAPISADLTTLVATPPAPASTLTYQWVRNGVPIAGATKDTYVPVQADLGKTLTLRIGIKAVGYAAQPLLWESDATDPVASTVFAGAGQTIEALRFEVGQKLTANVGTWSLPPTSYAYQWYRRTDGAVNFVAIAKATAKVYTATTADQQAELQVRIVAKSGTLSATAFSDPVGIGQGIMSPVSGPSIPLVAKVGQKLTVSPGTWDVAPTSYNYQWIRNNRPILGATGTTYTPIPSDLGEELAVEVVAHRAGYQDNFPIATTLTVTVQPGAAQVATRAPALTIGGKAATTTVKDGQLLTASGGTWPVAPESLRYRWQTAGVASGPWTDLAGYDQPTLTPSISGDPPFIAGQYYRVVVTAFRTGYLPVQSASAAVRLVVGP